MSTHKPQQQHHSETEVFPQSYRQEIYLLFQLSATIIRVKVIKQNPVQQITFFQGRNLNRIMSPYDMNFFLYP